MRYVPHKSAGGYNISDVDKQWFHICAIYAPALHYRMKEVQGGWSADKNRFSYPIEILSQPRSYITDINWFYKLDDFSFEGIAKQLDV